MVSLAVNTKAAVAVPTGEALPINAAMVTFSAASPAFRTAFRAQARWKNPATNLGIADVLTPANWRSKFKAMGATEIEPIVQWVSAYFSQQSAPDAQGFRQPMTLPPHVVIGLRSTGVQTEWELDFTTATVGVVTITINPAPAYYDGTLALAKIEIIADGVKTAADLRDEAVAALNAIAGFSALYTAAPGAGAVLELESDEPGIPLFPVVTVTTGGPIITVTNTTGNTPGDYTDDLTLLRQEVELEADPLTGVPTRWFYWVTDTQLDDVVNAEGMAWCQAESDLMPVREAFFHAQSLSPLNYDPASAGASPLEQATVANGGDGWTAAAVTVSRFVEWIVAAHLGRCIGFLPGAGDGGISLSSRQLRGANRWARMTPQSFGDLETLIEDRRGNWYSAEGPGGSYKFAVATNGDFIDRSWAQATARYFGNRALLALLMTNHEVAFANIGFERGANAIKDAMLLIPGVALAVADNPAALIVDFVPRSLTPVTEAERREMNRYSVVAPFAPPIKKFGTPAVPLTFVIFEGA